MRYPQESNPGENNRDSVRLEKHQPRQRIGRRYPGRAKRITDRIRIGGQIELMPNWRIISKQPLGNISHPLFAPARYQDSEGALLVVLR